MEKVKEWRKKEGLKQSDVAGDLGISQGTYSRYERKQTPMPPLLARKLIDISKGKLKLVWFYSWISEVSVSLPEKEA